MANTKVTIKNITEGYTATIDDVEIAVLAGVLHAELPAGEHTLKLFLNGVEDFTKVLHVPVSLLDKVESEITIRGLKTAAEVDALVQAAVTAATESALENSQGYVDVQSFKHDRSDIVLVVDPNKTPIAKSITISMDKDQGASKIDLPIPANAQFNFPENYVHFSVADATKSKIVKLEIKAGNNKLIDTVDLDFDINIPSVSCINDPGVLLSKSDSLTNYSLAGTNNENVVAERTDTGFKIQSGTDALKGSITWVLANAGTDKITRFSIATEIVNNTDNKFIIMFANENGTYINTVKNLDGTTFGTYHYTANTYHPTFTFDVISSSIPANAQLIVASEYTDPTYIKSLVVTQPSRPYKNVFMLSDSKQGWLKGASIAYGVNYSDTYNQIWYDGDVSNGKEFVFGVDHLPAGPTLFNIDYANDKNQGAHTLYFTLYNAAGEIQTGSTSFPIPSTTDNINGSNFRKMIATHTDTVKVVVRTDLSAGKALLSQSSFVMVL